MGRVEIIHASSRPLISELAILGAPSFMFPRSGDGKRPLPAPGEIGDFGYEIDEDVSIFALAMVVSGTERVTTIRKGSRIGPRAQVGHDVIVGRDCCIGAAAMLCGFSEIGDGTTLGVGVTVVPFKKVGRNCFILAGSVVTEDIPDNCVYAGVPAKFKRPNS